MLNKILTPIPLLIIFFLYVPGITSDYPKVPEGHPRVFITAADIPILQIKKNDPEFQQLWNQILTLSNSHFLSAALIYLVNADSTKGLWAVNQALTAVQNKPGTSDAINKSSNIMNRAV